MDRLTAGRWIAEIVGGSWRDPVEPAALTESRLAAVGPLVLRTGGAALAWRRIRATPLADSPSGERLAAAARLHRLEGALAERSLIELLASFERRGVRPLLVKGWTLGTYYPERGLRPYGDFDFCIGSADRQAAIGAVEDCASLYGEVELLTKPNFPFDRTVEQLFDRAERREIGDQSVLVPCAEDHLRLLCLHMLNHGIWRPLWLCDVAAMLESLPPGFRWDRFLSGKPRYTEWVLAALRLAVDVLGAGVPDSGRAHLPESLPGWLAPAVLKQWGRAAGSSRRGSLAGAIPSLLKNPGLLIDEMAAHWQNPVEASVDLGAPFNEWPRWPYQVAAAVRRVPRLVAFSPRG